MRAFVTVALAGLTAAPLSALAQGEPAPIVLAPEPVPDSITLDDGHTITGHVTEVRLHEQVTIERADGTTLTFPWSRVRGMSADAFMLRAPTVQPPAGTPPMVFSADPNATTAPPPPPAGPVDMRAPGPGRVPMRVRSSPESVDIGVAVARIGTTALTNDPARVVCSTPCTLWVEPGPFPLWFGHRERPFSGRSRFVEVGRNGYVVDVHLGSAFLRNTGTVMQLLGVASMVGGLVSLDLSGLAGEFGGHGNDELSVAGAVIIAGGVTTLLGGIALRVTERPSVDGHDPGQ